MPPDRFTHEQLSEKARSLNPGMSQPGDIGPAAHGSIVPPGMGGTAQPGAPHASEHPSGGPTPSGQTHPDALGTALASSFDRDALHSNMPESISTAEIAARADRYGMNWSRK